jgi:hypothetical protein
VGPQAKGEFEVIDAATVALNTCIFTDMDTFIFNGVNNTLSATTFRRCAQVTQAAAVFTDCVFDSSTAAASLLSNNPSALTNCTFISDGSNHAIEATTAGTYTFTGHTFTNYATTLPSVPGSTGNEVFYNNSGGAITLNASGITDVISVRNGAGASTTVVTAVDFTITNIVRYSEIRIFRDSDDVLLSGVETIDNTSIGEFNITTATDPNNAGKYTATYSHDGTDGVVRIIVMSDPTLGDTRYQYLQASFNLTAQNDSLQIAQIIDRVYSNPT